jgi:ubiquitin-protein ligase E3 A
MKNDFYFFLLHNNIHIFLVVSYHDLEIWICGKQKVDFSLLQRHSRYAGGLTEDSPRIKYLWEVLHALNENEKLKFFFN